MKVNQMTSPRTGRPVPNQFIITDEGRGALGNFTRRQRFQSYDSVIAEITEWPDKTRIILDEHYWDYSVTTSKYRNMFLNMNTKEIKQAIDSGAIRLENLN